MNEKSYQQNDVTIFCGVCGAGIKGDRADKKYTCPACGANAVLARCPSCSGIIHITDNLWGKSVRHLACGRVRSWSQWKSLSVTFQDVSETLDIEPAEIDNPSRRVVHGILIGNGGYSLATNEATLIEFNREKINLRQKAKTRDRVEVLSYSEIRSIKIGGAGAVQSGGGWFGGGSSVGGIVTGVLLSAAMNKLTTKTEIETIVYIMTNKSEIALLNTRHIPEKMRIILSPVIARIQEMQRSNGDESRDVVEKLKDLIRMKESGLITEEEFVDLKGSLVKRNITE